MVTQISTSTVDRERVKREQMPETLINTRQYQRYQIIKLHENGVEKGVIAYFVNLDISEKPF